MIPDVIWITPARLRAVLDADGHLQGAPEFVAEVLSPAAAEADWDRQTKLELYDRVGVREYWIVDWERQRVSIYRREGDRLWLVGTLLAEDTLTSPLLPGFACLVRRLFISRSKGHVVKG